MIDVNNTHINIFDTIITMTRNKIKKKEVLEKNLEFDLLLRSLIELQKT